jgi:DDE superfamily endonuclease
MVSRTSDWRDELGRWLKPFLDRLGHKARRQMCPLYVSGLIRSWRPQERSADGEAACARRMRSIASLHCGRGLGRNACGNRTTCPSRQARRRQRCRAGDRRYCDTQERHAFGWCRSATQYASALGKTANCQTLVSLTLARGEVPVVLALRLFLPVSWTSKRSRLERAGVPAECRTPRTKPEMALAEIDRAIAAGVRFVRGSQLANLLGQSVFRGTLRCTLPMCG